MTIPPTYPRKSSLYAGPTTLLNGLSNGESARIRSKQSRDYRSGLSRADGNSLNPELRPVSLATVEDQADLAGEDLSFI